jgi:hypothetical protein
MDTEEIKNPPVLDMSTNEADEVEEKFSQYETENGKPAQIHFPCPPDCN